MMSQNSSHWFQYKIELLVSFYKIACHRSVTLLLQGWQGFCSLWCCISVLPKQRNDPNFLSPYLSSQVTGKLLCFAFKSPPTQLRSCSFPLTSWHWGGPWQGSQQVQARMYLSCCPLPTHAESFSHCFNLKPHQHSLWSVAASPFSFPWNTHAAVTSLFHTGSRGAVPLWCDLLHFPEPRRKRKFMIWSMTLAGELCSCGREAVERYFICQDSEECPGNAAAWNCLGCNENMERTLQ